MGCDGGTWSAPIFTRAEKGLKMEHLLEVKNLSDDLGLLQYDLQHSIRPLSIAQKLYVIQNGFPAPHAILNAKFDALAASLALCLRKGSIQINHAVRCLHGKDTS